MDISIFREFTEVVLQGSYSAAARTLNLSQPTLSRHMSALEKELSTKLVADVLPVRLTPAGTTVFQTALSMSDLYASMQDDLADLRHATPTRIRIYDLPTLRPLSPRIVNAVNSTKLEHPRTIIEYVTLRAGKTPDEAVAEGLCDLAFMQIIEEADVPSIKNVHPDLQFTALSPASNRVVFGIPKESALATAATSSELTLASLKHETFLMLARKPCESLKITFIAACKIRGFRPTIKMIPCDRYEEFYLLDHEDGIYVLAEDNLQADASFTSRLRERMTLVPLAASDGLSIRWHALHRTPEPSGALAHFLNQLAAPTLDLP